jgi:hypothetical protein
MTLPPEKRLKFFVYIIESPSPVDLYHRRYESDLLAQAVRLDGIPCVCRIAVSKEALEAALKIGLPEEMKAMPGLLPVIHISAHGDDKGIQLTSTEIVQWGDLGELLRPINKALNGSLLVCMSCCKGFAGVRMAMIPAGRELPFFAIVGHPGSPTWSDTAVAFASFYHLVAKGEPVTAAADAMAVAAGTEKFFVETAPNVQKSFQDYLQSVNLEDVFCELQQSAAALPKDERAKFTDAGGH